MKQNALGQINRQFFNEHNAKIFLNFYHMPKSTPNKVTFHFISRSV